MSKTPVRVAVTGAAGNIGYALLFRIANGDIFGKDQPVIIHLVDLPQAEKACQGVVMELDDCAFPLFKGAVVASDLDKGFGDVDVAILVGGKPRGPGMERADLLKDNGKIFVSQGEAIDRSAKADVKVLVVANPCNTNALVAASKAKRTKRENYTAMTRLDQNRALAQLAIKSGSEVASIERLGIWGNHSPTMYPNFYDATIHGKPVTQVITDDAWLKGDFMTTVQKRGAAIIDARGQSSAASAANAAIDHVRDWALGTVSANGGERWVSMGIPSKGEYGIPEGLNFSYPVRVTAPWKYEIVQGLELNDFSKAAIKKTTDELVAEREFVKDMI